MKTRPKLFLAILLLYLFLSYLAIFVFTPERIKLITRENHYYENVGALSLFSASIIFFILFFKDRRGNDFIFLKTRRNIFFLLLAFLLFFGFGEELSWGQWIFHWQTPDLWRQINVQGETNIHNLVMFNNNKTGSWEAFWAEMLDMNRMFSFFWLTYFFVFPILNMSISRFSAWVGRLNIPLVPIWMAILYPLNYLIAKIIELHFINVGWGHQVEIRESYFEVLLLMFSLWIFTEYS